MLPMRLNKISIKKKKKKLAVIEYIMNNDIGEALFLFCLMDHAETPVSYRKTVNNCHCWNQCRERVIKSSHPHHHLIERKQQGGREARPDLRSIQIYVKSTLVHVPAENYLPWGRKRTPDKLSPCVRWLLPWRHLLLVWKTQLDN